MLPREVVLLVPDAQAGETDAVRREAGAVLASAAPDAALRLEAGRTPAVVFDGEPVRLARTPGRAEADVVERRLAWAVFWALLERLPTSEAAAPVACYGALDAASLNWLDSTLGISIVPATPAPIPTGIEPGPRLAIGGLLSPVIDEHDGSHRGSRSVQGVLGRAAARLVGEGHATALLARVERQRPYVAETVRDRLGVPLLTTVMRQLADEGVPLTQPRLLCEALLATTSVCPPTLDAFIVFEPAVLGLAWSTAPLETLPPHVWTQRAREGLKAHHASRFSEQGLAFRPAWGLETYGPQWTMTVGMLDRSLEQRITDHALPPEEVDALLDALEVELARAGRVVTPNGAPPPLLTTAASRFFVWMLVRDAFPELSVLAYQELIPEVTIQPLFHLSL